MYVIYGPRPRSRRGSGYTPSLGIIPVLHDCKDAGGRATQESKPRSKKHGGVQKLSSTPYFMADKQCHG